MADNFELYDELINSSNASPELFAAVRNARSLENQITRSGAEVPDVTPRQSGFAKFIDVISTPQQWVQGVLDSALVRGDIGDVGIIGAAKRGADEDISGSDILRRSGVVENPILRGVLGFGLDVALDPVNYVTLGAGAAATRGGKVLSKAGTKIANQLEREVLDNLAKKQGLPAFAFLSESGIKSLGDDALGQLSKLSKPASDAVDDVFTALGEIKSKTRELKRLEKSGAIGDEAKKFYTDAIEKMREAITIKAGDTSIIQEGMGADELVKLADDVISNPRLGLGMNIPFLGAITGQNKPALEYLAKDDGPVGSLFGSVLKGADKIIKSKEVGKSWELSNEQLDMMASAAEFASNSMRGLKQVAEGLPLAGKPIKAINDTIKSASDFMQETFLRSTVIGTKAHRLEIDLKNKTGRARQEAAALFEDDFGDFLFKKDPVTGATLVDKNMNKVINTDNMRAMEQAAIRMDVEHGLFQNQIYKAIEEGKAGQDAVYWKSLEKRYLGAMARLAKDELDGGAIADLDAAVKELSPYLDEDALTFAKVGPMETILKDPELPAEAKEAAMRMNQFNQKLYEAERAAGIDVGWLPAYVSRRYSNASKGATEAGQGGAANFAKARKFNTLKDALEAGKVADLDMPSILLGRAKQSIIQQSRANYENRMMLEFGLPADKLYGLYKEAASDPNGAAAQILRRQGFRAPGPLSPTDAANAEKIIEGSEEALQGAARSRMAEGVSNLAYQSQKEYAEKLRNDLWGAGMRPADSEIAGQFVKEIADKVDDVYLPPTIAKAIRENTAVRDVVKDTVEKIGGEFGAKTLKLFDAGNAFMKKLVTLPWPAYWAQNVIGDQFLRFMDSGLNAIEPGLYGRLNDVLTGRAVIRTASGGLINKDSFNNIMKEAGIKFDINDFMEVLDDAGKLDVDKLARSGKSVGQNLKSALKGDKTLQSAGLALEGVQNGLRDRFDTFFRATHLLHRLERGDSIGDAAFRANNALINYRDMSPVEQSLFRRFYMFYGWMSKSTKLTLKNLITRPGAVTTQLKSARALSEFFSDPNASPTVEQFEMNALKQLSQGDQVAFALGKDSKGKTIIGRGFGLPMNTMMSQFSIQLPRSLKVGEIINSVMDSATRTLQKQFASANPLINAGAQLVSGKNLYFNKPLNEDFLRRMPDLEAAGKALSQHSYTAIPGAVMEAIAPSVKKMLNGVSDGKGRWVVDPGMHWVLTNFVPGLGRAVGTANIMVNPEISGMTKLLQGFSGVRIEESDIERSYASSMVSELAQAKKDLSVAQRMRNKATGD